MNDFFVLLMMMLVFFLPYFFIFTIIKMSTGALGKIQGGLDSLGNKAKGTGYFGIKDRQKEKKEQSAWAFNKNMRKAAREKSAAKKQAEIIGGTRGSRLTKFGTTYGLGETEKTLAEANAEQQLHKIEEEEKNAQKVLLEVQMKGLTYQEQQKELLKVIDDASKSHSEREAAISLMVQKDMGSGMHNINDRSFLHEVESKNQELQSYLYTKRRDLSDNGYWNSPDPATGESRLKGLSAKDLASQSSGFWDQVSATDLNQDEVMALYNSESFVGLSSSGKLKIETVVRARGKTYNPSGGAADTAQQAAQAASTSPPPKVAPPSATYTTPDGKWYTKDTTPLIPDPSDPTKQIPNPAAKWKKTN